MIDNPELAHEHHGWERKGGRMRDELEVAKEIVEAFWSEKARYYDDKEVIAKLFDVREAEPKELVNDYEAIIAILEKALKQIREEK